MTAEQLQLPLGVRPTLFLPFLATFFLILGLFSFGFSYIGLSLIILHVGNKIEFAISYPEFRKEVKL